MLMVRDVDYGRSEFIGTYFMMIVYDRNDDYSNYDCYDDHMTL